MTSSAREHPLRSTHCLESQTTCTRWKSSNSGRAPREIPNGVHPAARSPRLLLSFLKPGITGSLVLWEIPRPQEGTTCN